MIYSNSIEDKKEETESHLILDLLATTLLAELFEKPSFNIQVLSTLHNVNFHGISYTNTAQSYFCLHSSYNSIRLFKLGTSHNHIN